jgi:hypothetical protein
MTVRDSRMSWVLCLSGVFFQHLAGQWDFGEDLLSAIFVVLLGTGLLTVGLMDLAAAKGRNPAWGLLALLSLIGLIIVVCLNDRVPKSEPEPFDSPEDGTKLVAQASDQELG